MTGSQQLILAEGAGGAVAANYIEDVFSTWLYPGSAFGSNITINNGIDLSTQTGMVWIKSRGGSYQHWIYDTIRGPGKTIASNLTNAQSSSGNSQALTSFTNTGFVLTGGLDGISNISTSFGSPYVSWTFRKQAKFFDVVTYTGTGSNRTIAHNLGSVPGCIIIKCTSSGAYNWQVYHRSLGATKNIILNLTDAEASNGSIVWNSTAPTSTVFSLGTAAAVNELGDEYVAYLFAHDAGGFGLTGTDNVISCGSVAAGTTNQTITLGYEPQFVLFKKSSAAGNWFIADNMRGINTELNGFGVERTLQPNTTATEDTTGTGFFSITATGMRWETQDSSTYIYIAIRRGPMKTPTSGTSVFNPNRWTSATGSTITTNFPVDMEIDKYMVGVNGNVVRTRLIGLNTTTTNSTQSFLITNLTNSEATGSGQNYGFNNTGFLVGANNSGNGWAVSFRRAPGFFDVVCYTGNGVARTINHNLGVAPELMIIKSRSSGSSGWPVYAAAPGPTQFAYLDDTSSFSANSTAWNDTAPTASVFTVGTGSLMNTSSVTYVAYLFASCPGVSKVGSYTGTGALQTVNCGFTGGARFVLIKRTDSTGDWFVYDSARGISSGNDPYLLLNSAAAEVTGTNYVDTTSVGFQVTAAAPAGLNASGGSYIFLAIA